MLAILVTEYSYPFDSIDRMLAFGFTLPVFSQADHALVAE